MDAIKWATSKDLDYWKNVSDLSDNKEFIKEEVYV